MDRFGEKTISMNQETMELIAEIFLCSLSEISMYTEKSNISRFDIKIINI